MSTKQQQKKNLATLAAKMGFTLTPAKTAKGKKAKNKFAKDMRSKRLSRREASVLGGVTAKERGEVAATLGKTYTREQWVKAIVVVKKAEGITFTKAQVKAAIG